MLDPAHAAAPVRDVEALATRMGEPAHPARRVELSRAARLSAERYSVERNLEANVALYEEVARNKAP